MAWVDQGQQYWLASVVIYAGVGDPISSNSRVRCKADHSAVVAQALTNILLLERQSGHLKLDGAEMALDIDPTGKVARVSWRVVAGGSYEDRSSYGRTAQGFTTLKPRYSSWRSHANVRYACRRVRRKRLLHLI